MTMMKQKDGKVNTMKTRKTLALATAALTAFMPLSYTGTALNNIPAVSAEV